MPVRSAYYAGFTPELNDAFASYGLGWHYDAGIQFVRLVLAGTFDRLPDLNIILGHWGEVILFYSERLAAMDRVAELDQPIATYLRRNLYVTASGMFVTAYLARAAAIVGTDRLLFSTDFPYQYRAGGEATLSGDMRPGRGRPGGVRSRQLAPADRLRRLGLAARRTGAPKLRQ